ncbi:MULTISPECIES: urea ABC transporter permease subunit UrtC [Actinosynnema]|uniref:urea ABC transporter permease subunit UrtC n=1 Tax=Actinosynnema TaxID=40566 RepID=UPI0020A411E1|nr:urea ABC transporter permease subunit UrtC [Actinosynnema pretiosum]MCP2095652.1 urea transport system permease protein [Actinosynnema pretiosum]
MSGMSQAGQGFSRFPRLSQLALPRLALPLCAVLLAVAPLVLSPFRLGLLAKYLCFAIVAVGIAVAWGRGGMLVLGQGVFFGLGGYAVGMHLKLAEAGPGGLPDFMVWSGVEELPALWAPFANPVFALAAVVLLPGAVAFCLGLLVFRRRVRGAHFAILSQALAAAFVLLLVGRQGVTGGTNGLTNFSSFFGLDLTAQAGQRAVYWITAAALVVVILVARWVVRGPFGRLLVAVRDNEDRVRFLGYDPALVKTLVFTGSAVVAGIGGALFVPVVGIISPALLGVVPSLELLVGVAVGGRFSLAGAVLGAIAVNYAKTAFSEDFAEGWLYLQGGLFVLVLVLAPRGLAGLVERGRERWAARRSEAPVRRGAGVAG